VLGPSGAAHENMQPLLSLVAA